MRLAITCGLPLSGKSTLCESLKNDGYVIVCPDNIRVALHGQQFVDTAEPLVWAIAEIMVRSLLDRDHKVVIDATNTTKKARSSWVKMAKIFGIPLNICRLITPKETCIYRNEQIKRLDNSIIERMDKQFQEPTTDEGYVYAKFI